MLMKCMLVSFVGILLQLDLSTQQDQCGECVDFSFPYIYQLTNVANGSVVNEDCAAVCDSLKAESKPIAVLIVCNSLCNRVGVDTFISVTKKSDEDPMYFCALLLQCFIKDKCDVSISSFNVTPSVIVQGKKFVATVVYKTENGTGMGQSHFQFQTPDGVGIDKHYLLDPQFAGQHIIKFDGTAAPDSSCVTNCEKWIPGIYSVTISIEQCNGECGSNNLKCDQKSTTFEVAKKNLRYLN